MTASFWSGRRVFVTGHTGFKGSWLALWLQQRGAHVTGYSLAPPTNPSLFDTARVEQGMKSIHGDVRDRVSLLNALRRSEAEIVIHMAAQALVRQSYVDPVETYSTNVMGTVNLLEGVREVQSVRAVVVVTTDKCYENREWVWPYRENEPLGGRDPYSNSKACAELVASAYRSSFLGRDLDGREVAVATARAGNVIGGGDWAADRLVPDILRAFSRREPVEIRNPSAIRPWQHVLEPLNGYLLLAEKLYTEGAAFAESWNFGPDISDARPVSWITAQLAERWGPGASWYLSRERHPHEAQYLKLDISKSAQRLAWQPVLRLGQALDLIVNWDRESSGGADVRELTLRQIAEYESRASARAETSR